MKTAYKFRMYSDRQQNARLESILKRFRMHFAGWIDPSSIERLMGRSRLAPSRRITLVTGMRSWYLK
jgi:hypothetical protein